MLDFPRWKVWSIWGVLALLCLLAVPTFIPERITAGWGSLANHRVNKGLDLAGGSYLLLEADADDFKTSRIETLRDQIAAEMRRATPPIEIGDISTQGGQISFMLRDPSQVDAAREKLLGITGTGVGFTGQRQWDISVVDTSRFIVRPTQAGLDQAVNDAMNTATEVVRKRIDALGTKEPTIVRQGTDRILVQVPGLQNPQELKELIGKTAKLEFKLVDDNVDAATLLKGIPPLGDQILKYPGNPAGVPLIAVKRSTIVGGDQLVKADPGNQPETNQPIVNFTFDSNGGKRFAKVTQENQGKLFAIILDNQVISAPRINTPILGGSGYIEGNFTAQSANELAISLRSGSLPIDLKVIEESTVSPELGADSIHKGILASVVAVVLVVVFMFVTYGRFGAYANLAVIINVFVILGVLALLSSTLTLPGIAGFVLTIGTAVDANVLINERIREERRRGRSVVQAVELGYKEASRTIFEANMTHGISGVIMFVLGSGPIKGFAVVLLIGIATSVFTAVTFTRMLVAQWIRRTKPKTINI